MKFYYSHYGLNRESVKKIINEHLQKNADILIGVDDPDVNQLVDVIVEAFADAIEKNNRELRDDIDSQIKETIKNLSAKDYRFRI
jgi:DNA-binding protein YbaB